MKFLSFNEIPENHLLEGAANLQSLMLFKKYYQEYYKEKFIDLSFLILQEDTILGYVLCCMLEGKLSLPDGGVIITLFKPSKQHYVSILTHLEDLAKQHQCTSIIIKDDLRYGNLSILGEELFNRRFESRLTFEMEIGYECFTLNNFHKILRKSYKSLINWGRKNLEIIYINKENYSLENFEKFKEFHYQTSQRKTRSDESWQVQYEMIKEGYGELILAWYEGNLVAGSLFSDYGDTSIYFTGVYERSLFHLGLSHFLLYSGISRSYERGNTTKFSLGYFDSDIKDPKWFNIQFFKKGFCKDLLPTIFWAKEIN